VAGQYRELAQVASTASPALPLNTDANVRGVTFAVEDRAVGPALLRDWDLLARLNEVRERLAARLEQIAPSQQVRVALAARIEPLEAFGRNQVEHSRLPFRRPYVALLGALWTR
jgi:hypothetical protein